MGKKKDKKKRNKKKNFLDLLSFMPDEFSGVVSQTLKCMDIAEEEIENFQIEYPQKSKELFNSFKLLTPSPHPLVIGDSLTMFRNHCREILRRVVREENTTLGTKAEVMLTLSQMSLKAPLTSNFAHLYYRLFKKIFGEKKTKRLDIEDPGKELYEGEAKELFRKLQKKIRQDWRRRDR